MLPDLLAYGVRILPGLLLIGACFALARAEQNPLLRILTLILGSVLIRDAMTPLGLWRLGAAGGVPWLRFTDQAGILLLFALGTVALTAAVLKLDSGLRSLVRWARFTPVTLTLGIGGGMPAAAPVLLLFSLAREYLMAAKVIRPGVLILAKMVGAARKAASDLTSQLVGHLLTEKVTLLIQGGAGSSSGVTHRPVL
ncbi:MULTISPECIES: hypothetical protein [Streptosporangium]|uniref:Cation/H+ exchanger domain-containing protein n=1 Tax=Streptosporangium brasiliense TaxID=47480 RepID=A0ABT9RNH4_9ACTN|nr:hypothetical protein [Streptosporangium brasiliense]MDP9869855.1 hypothetical protein [Streptosporangium brasiliense]